MPTLLCRGPNLGFDLRTCSQMTPWEVWPSSLEVDVGWEGVVERLGAGILRVWGENLGWSSPGGPEQTDRLTHALLGYAKTSSQRSQDTDIRQRQTDKQALENYKPHGQTG